MSASGGPLDNHHIVLCIGAAIFDYFHFTFAKDKNDGEIRCYYPFVADLFRPHLIQAQNHLRLLALTCKRVREILYRAFANKESYFLLYHYFHAQRFFGTGQILPGSRNAFRFMLDSVSNIKKWSGLTKLLLEELHSYSRICTGCDKCITNKYHIIVEINPYGTMNIPRETYTLVHLEFPWATKLRAPDFYLQQIINQIDKKRELILLETYKKYKLNDYIQGLEPNDMLFEWSNKGFI